MTDFTATIKALDAQSTRLNASSKLIQDGAEFIPDLTAAPATAGAIMQTSQPAKIGKDWDEMSRAEQLYNATEGGLHGLKKSWVARDAERQAVFAEQGLQSAYDVEESLDPEADAAVQALLTGNNKANRDFKEDAQVQLRKEVQRYRELQAQDVLYKQPEAMERMTKAAEGKGFWSGLGAAAGEFFSGDVFGNAIYLAGTSTGAMLPYIAAAAFTGGVAGLSGVGALTNMARGVTMAYGSYQNEFGQFTLDELERRGVKPDQITAQSFRDLVKGDDYEQFAHNRANRASFVSAFDFVSGYATGLRLNPSVAYRTLRTGLNGLMNRGTEVAERAARMTPERSFMTSRGFVVPKAATEAATDATRTTEKAVADVAADGVAKTAGKTFASDVENMASQATVQGLLGGAGEYLGSKAAGLDPNMADVLMEALGEFTSAPVEVATSAVSSVTDARRQVLHAQVAKTFQEAMTKANQAAEAVGMKIANNETVQAWAKRVGEGKSFSAFAQDLVENKQVEEIRKSNPELAEKIETAAAEGKSVEVPVSDIVSIATKNRKAADDIIMDCRPTVDGLSVRQADDFAKNGRKQAEKQFDRTLKRFRVPENITKEANEIGTWIKARLVEAKFSDDYAASCSAIWKSYLVQRAKLLGTSPKEIARMMNWGLDLGDRETTGKTGPMMPMATENAKDANKGKPKVERKKKETTAEEENEEAEDYDGDSYEDYDETLQDGALGQPMFMFGASGKPLETPVEQDQNALEVADKTMKAVTKEREGTQVTGRGQDTNFLEDQARWLKWKPETTSTGKVKGAPPEYTSNRQFPALLKRLKKFIDEGEVGRYWYEDSAEWAYRMVGGNVKEAERLIQLIAIYSPQMQIGPNLVLALRAYTHWKWGRPAEDLSLKTSAQDEKARAVLYRNDPWQGRKTNSFYQNLMYAICVKHEAECRAAGINVDDVLRGQSTIDMWMKRAFGYSSDSTTDDKGSGQYAFCENTLRRVTAEINAALPEGADPWTPHQVQAAIWTGVMARYQIVHDATDEQYQKVGLSEYVPVLDKKGKPRLLKSGEPQMKWQRKSDTESMRKQMMLWHKNAMAVPSEEAKQWAIENARSYATEFERIVQQVTYEVIPSADVPGAAAILAASPAVKRRFTEEVLKIFQDGDGQNSLFKMLGIPLGDQIAGDGGYAGGVTPNTIARLLNVYWKDPSLKDSEQPTAPSKDVVRKFCRIIQYVCKQDAVPFFRVENRAAQVAKNRFKVMRDGGKAPKYFDTQAEAEAYAAAEEAKPANQKKGVKFTVSGGQLARGYVFTFENTVTDDQLKTLLDKINETAGQDYGFTRISDKKVMVANYRGDDGLPFGLRDEDFVKALNSIQMDGVVGKNLTWLDSEYGHVQDWKTDPEGTATLQLLEDGNGNGSNRDDGRGSTGTPARDGAVERESLVRWKTSYEGILRRYTPEYVAELEAGVRGRSASTARSEREIPARVGAEGSPSVSGRASQEGPRNFEGVVRAEDIHTTKEYGEPGRPGAVRLLAIHFSKAPRDVLDGSFYGTGMKGAEARRVEGDSVLSKRVYFYTDIGNGIVPEDDVGNVVHAVLLNNIYDISEDPLGIRKEVSRTVTSESRYGNELERHIHDAGFDGYVGASSGKGSRSIVLIGDHKVPVDVEGTFSQTGKTAFRPTGPGEEAPVITDTTGGRDVISKYIVPKEFRALAKVPGSGVTEEGAFLVLDAEGMKKAQGMIPDFEKWHQILMPNGAAAHSFHQDEIEATLDNEYLSAVQSGDMDKAREMVEARAKEKGYGDAIPEQAGGWKVRTKPAPKKTFKAYKVFFVDEQGQPTTLFVGDPQAVPRGVWVDAKEAFHITDARTGRRYVPTFSNPNRVGADGKKKTQKTGITIPIPDEATKAELVRRGFVGPKATTVTCVAYRPGWHAGTLPYFPQGGQKVAGSNYGMVHEARQVVFEIEVAADKDYTDIARSQDKAKTKSGKVDARKADLDYLPKDGMYFYTTNPMLNPAEDGWVISDSIRIVRALSQEECDVLLAKAGKLPQEWAQGELVLEDVGITDPNASDEAKKTLAPVTYDANGNVIPLSKRFDPNNDSVLYQDEDARPRVRGAYNPVNTFNPTQGLAGVIHLAETADRSTFMHESAHAWLDADTMLGLKIAQKVRDGEKITAGETTFLKNLGGFFEWGQREGVLDLGVIEDDPLSVAYALEQWAHMPVADQRGMHELFARGFEAYLLEGDAPSPEMVSLFQRFRSWLKDIYARAKNAIKPISPEVQRLYDLMFVSEQEAADAEARAGLRAMFDEADRKKLMTDEESAQYEMLEEEANAETQTLLTRTVSGVMGTFTRHSDKVRRQIMRQFKSRVDHQEKLLMQTPRYKAWHILRSGWKAEDGTVWRFKLSGAALKRGGYDKETIKLIRKKRFVTNKRPGISLSKLAKIVGSPSATVLLGELLEVTSAKEEAADIVASQVKEETGHDIETYSRLKADLAAHNKTRSRLLTAEFNLLARLMGRKQLLVGAAREYAQKRLADTKISDIKPYSYELDERRCAAEAEEAWRKGDYQRCLEMKRAQIVNHELARVALEIKDEQTKALRRVKRGLKSESVHPANRQILAYVAYLHDLAPLPKQFKAIVKDDKLKRAALRAASDLLAEGTPVDGLSPDPETGFAQSPLLENRLRVNDMTVSMARDLFSMLQQVEKLGRDRLTIERNGIKEDARQEIAEGTQALALAAANQHRVRQEVQRTPTTKREKFVDTIKQFFYAHIKISTWCRIFDRNQDGGYFWNHFIRTANERANWEESKRAEVAQRLQEILAVVADDKTGIWDRDFVKIGQRMMSKGERIAAALNMGNESNLQRLMDGDPMQWTGDTIQELKESLSSAEWIMVQNIWDLFESLRPLIAEKQKRVYGVEPIWIDPKPFEVVPTDGAPTTVRGGYYPVVYDPRGSKRAEQLSAAAAAEQLMKGAFQSSTTNRSFTKQRSERVLGRPLRLDLSALYSGLDDIIHDLAWHEWLINTQRLLNGVDGDGSGLSRQIKELYGYHIAKSFDEWTQAIAQGDRSNTESFARNAMKWLAGNIGLTAMGFSVSSAVSQITGIGYIIPRAGVQATLGAIRDAMSGRMALRAAINERSDLMRTRFISANRQVSEVRNRLEKGKEGFIKKYAYTMMMGVQHAVDTICWQAQYRRCLDDGISEEEAIARADQAVIDTQSSGRIVDESAVERSDLLGPFTVFYSWANAALNMEYAVAKGEENKAKRLATLTFYAFLMPQIDALLRDCLKAQGDDDDDDDDDAWWLSALIRQPFANAAELHFGMFVGFREVSSTVKGVIAGEKVFDYAGPGGTRGVTVGGKGLQAIAEIGDSLWNDDKDFSWKSFNALVDVAGFAGAPTAQIKRTIKGVRAIESGQAEGFDALKAPIFGFEGPISK